MARVIIFFGLVLCGQTVTALFLSASKYPAEFLPMMVGIPVLFAGVVSLNPHRRRRIAWSLGALSVIGILLSGFLAVAMTSRVIGDRPVDPLAYGLAGLMFLSCLTLLLISFLIGRNSRSGRLPLAAIDDLTPADRSADDEAGVKSDSSAKVRIVAPEPDSVSEHPGVSESTRP